MLISFVRRILQRPAEDGDATSGSSGSGSDTIGTGNDARVAMLNSINDGNDATRADELQNVNDDDTTEPFQPPAVSAEELEVEEATPAPEVVEPPTPKPTLVKLKVNGEELELPLEEVIARAQKVSSADKYLADAKRQAKPAPVVPTGPSQEELQRQQDEEDAKLVRALQMGTEDEAKAAIRKIREHSPARPSFNQDDVSRVVDERLTFSRAVEKFQSEFSDIVSDPKLMKLALQRDQELLAEGDGRSYYDRYAEIGAEIRDWKKGLAPAPTPPSEVPTLQDKQARKAAAPKPPVVASAKTKAPAQDDEGEESTADVIRNMAKSRGGPQWMRS